MHSDMTDLHNVIGDVQSVYLSGPMTNMEHNNVEQFARWHSILRENDIIDVYDPAYEWMSGEDEYHDICMRRTIHELTRREGYDCIIMLPEWKSSLGASIERDVAIACGIPVFYAAAEGDMLYDKEEMTWWTDRT